jgi:hypothetical protein
VISNDLLRKAVRAEYTLIRTPLAVLDEQIVSRYTPRGSRVQTSLARTIGALDALADRLLTEQPGQPQSEPADRDRDELRREPTDAGQSSAAASSGTSARMAPPRAAAAPADATSANGAVSTEASAETAIADAGEPAPLPETEQEQIGELAEDLLEAEQEQTFAGELAEDEELRRVQAELRAKHTVEERDESS